MSKGELPEAITGSMTGARAFVEQRAGAGATLAHLSILKMKAPVGLPLAPGFSRVGSGRDA